MNPVFLLKFQQNLLFYEQGFLYKYVFYRAKKHHPSHDSGKLTLTTFYRKKSDFFAPKIFEVEKSPKCAQGHTTTQRSHAQKHSIHRKARFCASNQRSFSMRRLVAKYRFVKSDLWSLCSTNEMAR